MIRTTRMPARIAAGLGCAAAVLTAAPAASQTALRASVDVLVELEDQLVVAADGEAAELNDLYVKAEALLALRLAGRGGLFATVKLEPVIDPERDRAFEDLGLFAEELYLGLELGPAGVDIGKLRTPFGIVNEVEPGLFGDEIASGYEMTERLGLRGSLPVEADGATHILSAALLTADTSELKRSLFTERDTSPEAFGHRSDRTGRELYVVQMSGALERSAYALGVRYRAPGEPGEADETGAVFAFSRAFDWGRLTGEAAYFPRYEEDRASSTFLTLVGEVPFDAAEIVAAYGLRHADGTSTDHFLAVSLGYEPIEGVALQAGYRLVAEAGDTSHTIGLNLGYEFDFD
ncbi:MAG: hypothetical protein H6923_01290 [Alphaproteobacteria bacterium]|nr:hypothetical protein [Alphaproteobacteria bacterium]